MKKTLVILLYSYSILFSQYSARTDSLLNLIKKEDPEYPFHLEGQIIGMIYNSPFDSGKVISDKVLDFAPQLKNKTLNINTLIHSWRFYQFEDKIKMLNKAYKLAEYEEKYDLIGAVYIFKATAFRDNSMTDSAMIYSLKAKDIFENHGLESELNSALNLIADLHFYSGQFDKAEKLYRKIMKGESANGKTWRYFTVQNNIGLIRIEQKKYFEAEKLFENTLNFYTSQKMYYADSARLPYLYKMLLVINVLQENLKEAEEYYFKAKTFSDRFKMYDELPEIYTARGSIFLKRDKYDSALVYFKKAESLNQSMSNIKNTIKIYDGLATTYNALNKLNEANQYLNLLRKAETYSDSVFHRSKYMNLYAEQNYNNSLIKIEQIKKEKTLLISVLIIVTVSLSIIIIYYVRLNRTNRKLVDKNLELVFEESNKQFIPDNKNLLSEVLFIKRDSEKNIPEIKKKDIDSSVIDEIILKLEELHKNEKFYLKSDLTINELSDRLNTNRTYLSKAVSQKYNVNFIDYINNLRVKEAIRIIYNGEASNLSIDGIAKNTGFNNRVSFAKAFRKYSGVSPSFFIKNIHIRDSKESTSAA